MSKSIMVRENSWKYFSENNLKEHTLNNKMFKTIKRVLKHAVLKFEALPRITGKIRCLKTRKKKTNYHRFNQFKL